MPVFPSKWLLPIDTGPQCDRFMIKQRGQEKGTATVLTVKHAALHSAARSDPYDLGAHAGVNGPASSHAPRRGSRVPCVACLSHSSPPMPSPWRSMPGMPRLSSSANVSPTTCGDTEDSSTSVGGPAICLSLRVTVRLLSSPTFPPEYSPFSLFVIDLVQPHAEKIS